MEEVTISPNSVFIGHSYLQHAGPAWRRKYCLRYHMYLILEEMEWKDAIDISYGNGLSISPKAGTAVGGDNSAVVVEINMSYVTSEDDRHVQAGGILHEYCRRATYLFLSFVNICLFNPGYI